MSKFTLLAASAAAMFAERLRCALESAGVRIAAAERPA